MQIAGIHNHSYYSPLDGFCSPKEMVERAKEIGMDFISITDHGTLAGHRDFQRACKEGGIKPGLGEELYYSETNRYDKRTKASRQDGTSTYVHLIAVATSDKGLRNLQAIDREAWLAYHYKPRMDWELLEQYNEDILFTSACMGGLLGKAINDRQDYTYAYEQAKKFKDLLGDRYYIELQGHNPPKLNHDLLELADELSIKALIAEDSHYASPDQKEMQEIFLILSTHPKMNREANLDLASKMELLDRLNYLYPDRKMSFQHINLFIAGYELRRDEMLMMDIDREDIYKNTLEFGDRVENYTYLEGLDTLPVLYDNPAQVLREKVYAGLKKLKLDDKPEYIERAEHELNLVESKGFPNYFLVVEDAVAWSKKQGIRSGKGRGSAAGSLICYSTGITGLDPLEYNLLFERFLDPDRDDMPDIDWDIMDSRRHEVKQYLTEKYGHVASISNINKYKGKKALKDAGRAIGVKFSEINKAMKILNGIDEITGHDVIAEFKASKDAREFNQRYPEVADIAAKLYGRINGYGTHAAGLVIANKPLSDYAPIETRKQTGSDERMEVVGLDKVECESLGLIKMDLLGLSTLTIIDDAIQMIKENKGIIVDIDALTFDDPRVFNLVSDGRTLGVFQFEQPASTKLCTRLKPNCFDDFVVINSLVRPGAWDAIGEEYLASKKGKRKVEVIHDDVKYFMDSTFHLPLYQEQLMKLCVDLAGMTPGQANDVRRGVGKKKREIIDKFKPMFVDGASKKIDKTRAERLWESFEAAGAYMFNTSHSAAYSVLSYQTAWLKVNYPLEFMCAILRNESDSSKVTDCLLECKQMGIKIKFPHINHSFARFTVEEDGLRMGLSGVKYISDISANKIINYRPFETYDHFKKKVLEKGSGLTSRVLSSLNSFGGASFDDNPVPEDYRSHLYDTLGIPAFEAKLITSKMRDSLRNLEDYEDDETFVCMAMVKQIKRGEGWARVDMVDSTGTTGVFADQDTTVEKGKMYVFLIGNNRIMKHISLDNANNESEDIIMDYLRRPILEEIPEGQHKILAAQARTTKTGKKIGYVVACNSEKQLSTFMVFEKNLNIVRAMCKIGTVRKLTVKKLKDGTYCIDGVY